jgi:transposase
MMGRQKRDQGRLFYEFRLEDRIPENHLLRRMNVFVAAALADLHKELKSHYSAIGRPSIDPELMIRMLIVGYCYGIRSERKLTQEVELHLAYRWFCKLDLEDKVPHHSTFSENRLGRFRDSDLLRHIFERVVWAAMAMGLVKGEGFAVDASVLEANASRYHGKAPGEISWTDAQRQKRAVAEYLDALDAEAKRQAHAESDNNSGTDGGGADSEPQVQAERQPANRKPPKVISPSDPASAWTAKANKRVQFGYGLNYLIDVEHAVIIDVEATPARTYDEVAATRTMLDRTEACFDLKPKRLAADTAYGTGKFLAFVIDAGITPHIPVWDRSTRDDGTFSRADFVWNKRKNVYVCPAGKTLTTTGHASTDHTIRYNALVGDCRACPLKSKCCPNMPSRRILRDVNEDARDVARRKMKTKAFLKSRDQRKRVEMRFAHLKTHHRFERMRLRGLSGARDEFHLAAIVQNLKTLALRLIRPPPQLACA